jgi:hypothetical protein
MYDLRDRVGVRTSHLQRCDLAHLVVVESSTCQNHSSSAPAPRVSIKINEGKVKQLGVKAGKEAESSLVSSVGLTLCKDLGREMRGKSGWWFFFGEVWVLSYT